MAELDVNISYRQHDHDKKWEYRLRFIDPFTNKPTERSKRGFRTKAEAKHAAELRQQQIQQGYDQTDIYLKDFLDYWLREYKKGSVRHNTYAHYNNCIKNHIKPYFKNIKLKNVTPSLYQEFLNSLVNEKKLERSTVIRTHVVMLGAMKRAKINKTILDNPCENAVIPGENKKGEIKFIDSSEIGKLLHHAYEHGYVYWIFFKVLIETGMRKGEAAALQWPDINFKDNTIRINKSLYFAAKNKEDLFGGTKTYSSQRTIKMSKSLANDLKFHLKWQNQNKKYMNDLYHHDLNLVLCRKDGNFMPSSSLYNAFARILKLAGIKPLPIHSLRHTHAVLQLEAGADMKYLQERLGHGSYQITADVYSHVSKKMEQKNTALFEEYMDSILK